MTEIPPEHQITLPLARVDLDLSGDPDLIRLARLTVSGVASTSGLGLEESERCRAAVDELCTMLFELAHQDARLSLSVVTDGKRLLVSGAMTKDGSKAPDPVRQQLGDLILSSTVTEWSLDTDADPCGFWFSFDPSVPRDDEAPAAEGEP